MRRDVEMLRGRRSIVVIVGGMLAMLSMSGCLFWGVDADLKRAQTAADLLETRVSQLEQMQASQAPSASAASLVGAAPVADVTWSEPVLGAAPPGGVASGGFRFPQVGLPPRAAFRKLLRGVVNVLTGWVEVPKRINETSETSGAGAGFTFGFVRGVGYGFIRTVGGAYEVATFPFPAPPDYRPVMRPEFIFLCDADT